MAMVISLGLLFLSVIPHNGFMPLEEILPLARMVKNLQMTVL